MTSIKHARTIYVDIYISPEEYLRHYEGHVQNVSAIARDGRRVQFPTKILTPFVTLQGIRGSFAIHFDAANKFVDIEKLA